MLKIHSSEYQLLGPREIILPNFFFFNSYAFYFLINLFILIGG